MSSIQDKRDRLYAQRRQRLLCTADLRQLTRDELGEAAWRFECMNDMDAVREVQCHLRNKHYCEDDDERNTEVVYVQSDDEEEESGDEPDDDVNESIVVSQTIDLTQDTDL